MNGGESSPASSVRGATVHVKHIRKHREDAEEQGITARPKRWPEGKVEAAAAMADGQKLLGHTQNGHTSHQTPKEKVGEREESKGRLTAGKSGSESARGRRPTRTANGGRRSSSVQRLLGLPRRERGENGAVNSRGTRGGGSASLKKRPGAGEGAPTIGGVGGGCPGARAGGFRVAQKEGDGADRQGPGVSG